MVRGHFLMTQISRAQAIREGSFGFLVQTIARTLDAKMKTELNQVGIDIKLFANLMLLSEEDGINQRQLGEKLNFFFLPVFNGVGSIGGSKNEFLDSEMDRFKRFGFETKQTEANQLRFHGTVFYFFLAVLIGFLVWWFRT